MVTNILLRKISQPRLPRSVKAELKSGFQILFISAYCQNIRCFLASSFANSEGRGFEPLRDCSQPRFECGALDRSANPPRLFLA